MPNDAGEKTEAPTPRRRDEAREQGQIAKSQDLGAAVTLLGGMIALYVLGDGILSKFMDGLGHFFGRNDAISLTPDQIKGSAYFAVRMLAGITLPIMAILVVLGLLVGLAQTGLLFTLKPLQPKLDKLNPINGAKRLVSARAFVRLGMSILKMLIVGTVAYLSINERLTQIVFAMNLDHWQLFGLAADLIFSLALRLGIILVILAILDYVWQRYKHEQDLKMTKEEVKEEMKRMEGDPVVKQRQRQVQQQLALQRLRSDVPKADVVVTNPTELAIAIKYDADEMAAPRVIAKGKDFMAQRIREIAIEYGIPIVERKPLAQALYKAVEVGQEVPPQFYKAVAEILAYVYEVTGRGPRLQRRPVPV
ncbi:MAG: flagellar biosynthesis protein FlhB [Phycisphaerae bacterium]|nr:flagellar biosynthesis protein FlhB [Phycisphaerae bacterium]